MARGHKTGGRTRGTPNKLTQDQRRVLQNAFESVSYGDTNKRVKGAAALVAWGSDNPTEFYRLWGRAIPHQVQGDPENPLALLIRVVRE